MAWLTGLPARLWTYAALAGSIIALLFWVRQTGVQAERAAARARSLQTAQTRTDVEVKNSSLPPAAVDERLRRWQRD